MNVRFAILWSTLMVLTVRAHVLPFVAFDYTTFCERTVPVNQRQKFDSYYKALNKRIALHSESQREAIEQSIYKTALQRLEIDQKKWADDINHFLVDQKYLSEKYDNDRAELRKFLYLYGSYEAFQVSYNIKHEIIPPHDEKRNFFDVVKNETQKIANKIGNWFQSVRTLFS